MRNRRLPSLSCTGVNFYLLDKVNRSIASDSWVLFLCLDEGTHWLGPDCLVLSEFYFFKQKELFLTC